MLTHDDGSIAACRDMEELRQRGQQTRTSPRHGIRRLRKKPKNKCPIAPHTQRAIPRNPIQKKPRTLNNLGIKNEARIKTIKIGPHFAWRQETSTRADGIHFGRAKTPVWVMLRHLQIKDDPLVQDIPEGAGVHSSSLMTQTSPTT